MHKAFLATVACSLAMLGSVIVSARAEAGFHHGAARGSCYAPYYLVPGRGSAGGYWACGGGGMGAATGGRHHSCRLHARRAGLAAGCGGAGSYCGAGACGYGGYSGCGSGCYGSGDGCGGGCSGCGDGCGGGCGDGCSGCGGGCSDCGQGEQPTSAEVIYDGPVPAGATGTQSIDTHEARAAGSTLYRLASNKRQDGSADFEKGLRSFRAHSFSDATASFQTAVSVEPDNAIYYYFQAMSIFELQGAEAASDALQRAVELERDQPIANWGKRMERIQGRGRVWIENARRAAAR
jgi:hypothetical protein